MIVTLQGGSKTLPRLARWCAVGLAVAATCTAVSISVLAGWQRGGWLSERLLWIAIGAVLVVSAHLLPALCRAAPIAARCCGGALWLVCMATACYGHATFFLLAQQHAGEARAASMTADPPAAPRIADGRSLSAIASARVALIDRLARVTDPAKRSMLSARLDALDVEAAEVQRREAAKDRVDADRDRDLAARETLRADPVSARLTALLGARTASIDLVTGLLFAGVLEGVACFAWLLVFSHASGATALKTLLDGATGESNAQSNGFSHESVTAVTQAGSAVADNDDLENRLRDGIVAGEVRSTVADIRRYLGCSQSRAIALRRQLAG